MYLPEDEIQKLHDELEYRTNALRPEINHEVNEAASLGDIPENFPYDAAVDRQRINEARINDLENILQNVQIKETKNGTITLGSKIKLENTYGQKLNLILIDSETFEKNPRPGFISNNSIVGKALMGKRKGDVIEVKTPGGIQKLKILGFE